MNKRDNFITATPRMSVYANDFDTDSRAFVPEVWAQESLIVLEENMVAANLVHRDFENEIASFGDVVNTRKVGEFEAKRKTASDSVTEQDASADKVQVKLNQHLHTTFVIKDEEMSKSFKDLVAEYLVPAVRSIARMADQAVLAQVYQFMGNSVGKLGTDPDKSTVIDANTLMNQKKVPLGPGQRNIILTPGAEGALLNVSEFTKVNETGENSALYEAMLGRRFGFDFYMSQNCPSVAATQTTQGAAVNYSDGYAIGSTSIVFDGLSGASVTAGSWCTIAGDMTPQKITNVTSQTMTIAPGLKRAVANNAVITIYPVGAVNLSAGYSAGYVKPLAVDGFSEAPLTGQLASIGSASTDETYGLIGTPTTTSILLDNALAADAANDAVVGLGPAGDYCFGFHRNAVALVSRPLALVPPGMGASMGVASYNGLSMRISMQYDSTKQGMRVTVDTLMGVKVLDSDLGFVMYA